MAWFFGFVGKHGAWAREEGREGVDARANGNGLRAHVGTVLPDILTFQTYLGVPKTYPLMVISHRHGRSYGGVFFSFCTDVLVRGSWALLLEGDFVFCFYFFPSL
jgi:hypothetical protein